MPYNSLAFAAFLIAVYSAYLLLRRSFRAQNYLLLAASYFFYGYWNWHFLALIAFTTLLDYSVGLGLERNENPRTRLRWLLLSLAGNIGVLCAFKYFNFFTESFVELLRAFGMHADPLTIHVILPVGISFYTFQSLSYTIDIYKQRMKATSFLPDYALFVVMFPQLLSGPIARAKMMLPQIQSQRLLRADHINAALFLIVWGYFKKVVVADNLALTANQIFDHYTHYAGVDLVVGVVAFALQIYCDFSGYSDIARGIAKLMGFELPLNFRLPYLALNPADFWSRWNISLSTWLRDYVYWPLASTKPLRFFGQRNLEMHAYRNMILTMLVGGLWHGASWNFVLWGGYYGVLLVIHRMIEPEFVTKDIWKKKFAAAKILPRMALMFALTLAGWVLFRSHSMSQVGYFFTHLGVARSAETFAFVRDVGFFSLPVVLMQVWQYLRGNLLVVLTLRPALRIALYTFLILAIFAFGVRESTEFIYFRF